MRERQDIGLKVQDVEIGKRVFYYPWVDELENSKGEPAVITSGPCEISGTLCCRIDIRSGVVALRNLSEENIPEKRLSAKKRRAKSRYQRFLELDGCWTDNFGEYIKNGWYKEVENKIR